MMRNKKFFWVISIIIIITLFYCVFITLRPVKIIAVHNRSSGFSDVLVDHFPVTTKGKIAWWLKNQDMLKNHYDIPGPEFSDDFIITFWYFGEGYMKQEKYDRLCFPDMQTKRNCIEKEKAFTVSDGGNSGLYFTVSDGFYYLKENGKIIKRTTE